MKFPSHCPYQLLMRFLIMFSASLMYVVQLVVGFGSKITNLLVDLSTIIHYTLHARFILVWRTYKLH